MYLHHFFGLCIQRAGGFVQDENPWVLEQRPRDGDALLLAPAHGHPSLAQHRVVAIGEAHHKVVTVGSFGSFKYLYELIELIENHFVKQGQSDQGSLLEKWKSSGFYPDTMEELTPRMPSPKGISTTNTPHLKKVKEKST